MLKIADNVKIEIDKSAIATVVTDKRGRQGARGGLAARKRSHKLYPPADSMMDKNVPTFLYGLLLLVLFGWYFFTDSERAKRMLGTVLTVLITASAFGSFIRPFDRKGPFRPTERSPDKPGKFISASIFRAALHFSSGSFRRRSDGEKKDITKKWWIRPWRPSASASINLASASRSSRRRARTASWCRSRGWIRIRSRMAREQLKKVAKLEFHLVHPHSSMLRADRWRSGQMPPPVGLRIDDTFGRAEGKKIEDKLLVKKKADLLGEPCHPRGLRITVRKAMRFRSTFDSEGAQAIRRADEASLGGTFPDGHRSRWRHPIRARGE